jgi:integrase/recombinase XerD
MSRLPVTICCILLTPSFPRQLPQLVFFPQQAAGRSMTSTLFDRNGVRKYPVPRERLAFVAAAIHEEYAVSTFGLALAFTGARISEVLALTKPRIDRINEAIVFRTLKQRNKTTFRAVPVPTILIATLDIACARIQPESRLWTFQPTTAWELAKAVMRKANISKHLCKPKALRHAFAAEAVLSGVPLNMLQRWMGHARLETTAFYANVYGEEKRSLARRAWGSIEAAI